MRKLVTVQTITEVLPIANADRLEQARVLGWRVVVGKGEFKAGDRVAFFEVDSILPANNPVFDSFQSRGQKTVVHEGQDLTGHVLRTMKLRGVVSQGLLMALSQLGLSEDLAEGTELTDLLSIVKYEAPIPMGGANILGPFQSRFAPKTDAVRIQNLIDYWDLIKSVEWEPTVKVDGTSQTISNDNGSLRIFGRNWELDGEVAPGMKVAHQFGIAEALESDMAVQFELVGPAIQGNKLKLSRLTPIVFALWKNGEKLPRSQWPEPMLRNATPILGDEFKPQNFETVDEIIEFVNGLRGNYSKDVKDEGVVYHPIDPASVPLELSEQLDRNNNFKVISNAFLLKHSE
jgi:RNA ligase (TIGR02306 family)